MPRVPPKKPGRQILGLDLLRAAAAYLVMLFHYTFWNWAHNPYLVQQWPTLYRNITPFTSAGWVGVDIFFVISGYIITYSVGTIGPAEFVRHRITRLLPSALLCSTITAVVYLALHFMPPLVIASLWLRSVTFWPLQPWIDGSYWTLPVEIAFYGLVLVCLLTRRSLLPWVMAAVGLNSTLWNAVLHNPHPHNRILLLLHGCFFGLGVFLYETLHRGFTLPRALGLAICLPGCIAEIYPHGSAMPDIIWIVGIAFLIASVRFNDVVLGWISPAGASLIRRIGLMTYPLYLVHDQVGNFLIQFLHTSVHVTYGWALALTMALMTALACAIVEFGEPPLKRAILRLYPKRLAGSRSSLAASAPPPGIPHSA